MKKSIKANTQSKLNLIIAVVAIFLGALYMLSKSLTSPQVALIENGSDSSSCRTLIDSISFDKECSEGYFQAATYTCSNGVTSKKIGTTDKCLSYSEIIAEAQAKCGEVCKIAASSATPSPIPSCVPNPCKDGSLCKLAALPDGQSYCPQPTSMPSNPPRPTDSPLPSGCYYQEVKCFQAPCDKILVCNPSPTPVPTPMYSSAPSPMPSSPTSCAKQLSSWKFRESCGNGSYRYIDFNCMGDKDMQTLGNTNTCKSESIWVNEAKSRCREAVCTSTSSSVVEVARPSLIPTPTVLRKDFWSCYRNCRTSRNTLYRCFNTCRSR